MFHRLEGQADSAARALRDDTRGTLLDEDLMPAVIAVAERALDCYGGRHGSRRADSSSLVVVRLIRAAAV